MGEKVLLFKFEGRDSDLNKSFDRIEARIERINKSSAAAGRSLADVTVRQASQSFSPNFNPRGMEDFARVSRDSNRIAEINARSQAKLAEETARRTTSAKNSELKNFENAEKSKQKLAEVSARQQAKESELATRAAENQKRREFSEYQRIERDKTRVAQTEAKKREASNVGKNLQSVGGGIRNVGIGFSAALTAPLVGFAIEASKAATESNDAIGQVKAALVSMGNVSGRTAEQLKQSATELMHLSTFDDDEILRKVTANLLTFGNVAGEQFDRAQKAAVDLSARLGQDLQTSTIQVGKALNNPIAGLGSLKRVGIEFTEQQKDQIKTLVASGKAAEAQKIILGELEREFGGAAKAARDNDPFAVLRNSADDFAESVGAVLNNALPPITNFIGGLIEQFNQLPVSTQTTIIAIAGIAAAVGPALIVIGSLVGAVGTVIEAFAAVAAFTGFASIAASIAPVIAVIGLLVAAGAGLYLAWQTDFGGIQEFVGGVVERVQNLINDFVNFLSSADVKAFTDSLQSAFNDAEAVVAPAIAQISADVNAGLQEILGFFDANGADLKAAAVEIFREISKTTKDALNGFRVFWATNGEQITAIVKAAYQIVAAIVRGAVSTIGGIIKLIAAVINGDWAKAWAAFKDIVKIQVDAGLAILRGLGTILYNLLKAAVVQGFAVGTFIGQEAVKLGGYLVDGLVNGIRNGGSALYNAVGDIAQSALAKFRSEFAVQSPSKVTTEIGEYITEGLAVGIENKKSAAVAAAKKVAAETIKAFKDAQIAFSKLAGASPEVVAKIQQTNAISYAKTSQKAPMAGNFAILEVVGENGFQLDEIQVGQQKNDSQRKFKGWWVENLIYGEIKNTAERRSIYRYLALKFHLWRHNTDLVNNLLNIFPFAFDRSSVLEEDDLAEVSEAEGLRGQDKIVRYLDDQGICSYNLQFASRQTVEFEATRSFCRPHRLHLPLE